MEIQQQQDSWFVLSRMIAGWSSLVARKAHNLEAVRSNRTPATSLISRNPHREIRKALTRIPSWGFSYGVRGMRVNLAVMIFSMWLHQTAYIIFLRIKRP